MYTCYICPEDNRFCHIDPKKVYKHMSSYHLEICSEDNNKLPKYPCIKTNCKTFRTWSALLRHIKKDCNFNSISEESRNNFVRLKPSEKPSSSKKNFSNHKTRETIDEVDNNPNLESFQTNLQELFNSLKTQGVSESFINDFYLAQKKIFNNIENVSQNEGWENIHSELDKYKTTYLRNKTFKTHKHYFSAKQYSIKLKRSKTKTKGKKRMKNKQCTFSYIHINKSLEIIFSNKSFRNLYENYNTHHSCNPKNLEGYCCGTNFKKSSFFKKHSSGLQIQIFYDDFVVNNSLGNKSINKKLGAIYFSIKNLPEYFLSKQDNIYLISLFKVKHIQQNYSLFNVILNRIRCDIKLLQSKGILIESKQFWGQLTSLSYDNLGANIICGMKRSFSAKNYCRICKLPKDSCKNTTEVEPDMLRNGRESKQIFLREGDKLGLVFYSKLNDIPGFNVFDNVSVDPMHDVDEGAIPFFLRIFFDHLLENNISTVDEITNVILEYELPSLETKNSIKK